MRAVVIDRFGVLPEVREVPDPRPHPDAVVLRVELTGLCRSDWHAWAGHDSDVRLPHVPGHELVGRVVEAGADVSRVQVGDRMTTPFVCGCGECAQCLAGAAQVCPHQSQPGFTHWGSFAELVEVRHADVNAIVVDEETPGEDLVGLGCRFATAFRGLQARAQVRAGELVAVLGCGGVGLSSVMIARALGAEVVAVDISHDALDLAREHGAAHVVSTAGMTAEAAADAVVVEAGRPSVTVEALGLEATTRTGLLALAPGGRHVQIGLLPQDPSLPLGRVIGQELTVLGSHGMAAADYPPMLDLVRSGRLRPGALVAREITLDETPDALVTMADRPLPGMTVIRP